MWHLFSLVNSWQSDQSTYGTGDPRYCVTSDGMVHLSGSLNGAQVTPGPQSETASIFAVLPQGARPDFCTSTEACTYAGVPGTSQIDPAGMMYAYAQGGTVYNSPSAQYTSLAGVSFPAAGTANWHALGLQSGWSPVVGDWCTTNADVQPAHALYLILNEGPAPHASLEIRTDGAVIVFGAGQASGVDSLSGLSYELTS